MNFKKDPAMIENLLSSSNTYKRGISNDQTCILTCKDRSGNLYVKPACIGRFASDAVLVTDSHNAYPGFAHKERIQLEQIKVFIIWDA